MLSVENIHVFYGKIAAVKGLSLKVEKGQIVTLLGANGTGKTTVLNTISGFLRSTKGSITYNNQKINNLRSDRIVRMGLVQVSQNRDLFPALSVYDNLMLGGLLQKNSQSLSEALDRVYEYFPILRMPDCSAAANSKCWQLEERLCRVRNSFFLMSRQPGWHLLSLKA
jgi:branched-chain amino acid transport system ATP-binding protein